ncbi:MAG: hypothetical protein AB1896_09795 [Thermodesulfobacteriota bacterium]
MVLVLIGVLAALVLPRLSGLSERERMLAAARRLAGLALEAHSQAATKARPWFFCLDLDRKRTYLATVRPGLEGDTGRESDYFDLPHGVAVEDVIHPLEGQVKEGRVSFGYWPTGGGEPGTIHLRTEAGDRLTIFLRPYLGRTEIKEGYLREEAG